MLYYLVSRPAVFRSLDKARRPGVSRYKLRGRVLVFEGSDRASAACLWGFIGILGLSEAAVTLVRHRRIIMFEFSHIHLILPYRCSCVQDHGSDPADWIHGSNWPWILGEQTRSCSSSSGLLYGGFVAAPLRSFSSTGPESQASSKPIEKAV